MTDQRARPRGGELTRYVPRIAAMWDDVAPDRQWQEVDGTLCFLDISGFTSLSERLASRGRIGAEELTDILNRLFSAMLRTAYSYEGSLIKFGGDALLLLFSGENHALRAASAVVAMQHTLRTESSQVTAAGTIRLRMSVGVHSGRIQLYCVGTSHRELVITGPVGTMTTTMEHTAEAGEVVVSSSTRDLLPRGAVTVAREDGWRLKWRKPPLAPLSAEPRSGSRGGDVSRWVPATLRSFLTAATPEPEHRVATVGFVRFCGIDEMVEREGPAAVAAGLQEVIDVIQAATEAEGITFLATDINEDGGKVLLVAGAPTVQEDDEGRLLRAVRRIADANTRFDLHIGVHRGHVFAGEVGPDYRATYTVMGDTVNVAARLSAAAWAGTIYATAEVLERSHTQYATERLEPLTMKGKAEPMIAYSVGEDVGFRTAATRTDLPFVGRRDELATVLATVDAASTSRLAATTLVGETGVGKSRVVDEALRARPDLRIVEVRAEPYGTANPYRPLRDPVRDLLGVDRADQTVMAQELEAHVRRIDRGMLPLVPLLGDVAHIDVPETSATRAIEPRFRRDRLADAAIAVFNRILDTPTVFVVEDGHWLDEASSHLLSRLSKATSTHPWAVLSTRRHGEDGFWPDKATTIELGPLSPEESEELVVAATAATPLRPHETDAIVARAGGNPLFLEETIKVVRETGGTGALPESLSAVVGTRIDALPPLARRILRYSSVLGRSFRRSALLELLEGEHITLDAATRRELREFLESDTAARLRFRHAMARDVAYDGLSFRRRRQLHLRAAAAAERHAAGHVEDIADLLATHYALGADHDRAWRFSRIAGDHARDAYANVEAAASYERALESARRLKDVPAPQRAAVWINLGDVRGPIGQFEEALDAYRRASRLLGDDRIARADLHYKRALMRERAGAYGLALREVTIGEGLLDATDDPAGAARLTARLVVRRAFVRQAQERPAEAMKMARLAVDAALAAGEPSAEGHARMIIHWAHLVLGIPGGAVEGERALEIFQSMDELESLSAATNLLGADAYYTGRWDDAVAYYLQGKDAADRSGNVVHSALFQSNIGEVLVDQRRFDEAEPLLRGAARVQRGSGWIEGADIAELYLGRLLSERGDTEEAIAVLERVRTDHLDSGRIGSAVEATIYLAQCLGRAGRLDEASALLDEIEGSGDDFVMHSATLARVRSDLLAATGDSAAALRAAERGLVVAEEQHLEYERALLLLAIDELNGADGTSAPSLGRTAADAILARLGVQPAPQDRD